MPRKVLEDVTRPHAVPKAFLQRNRRTSQEEDIDDDMNGEEVEIHHKKSRIKSSILSRPRRISGPGEGRGWRKLLGVLVGVLLFLGVGYYVSVVFARAHVEVGAKSEPVQVDAVFTAVKGGTEGLLHYQVMNLSASDTVSIPATGTEKVEKKASGMVVLYNAYSSKPQNLVATTRLKASGGKVYRIPSAVTIPGAKTEKGVVVPGSIEVKVVADAPGPDYNIALVDFSIPGFEGSPKFTKIYGRSKTAMEGGASGTINVAPPEAVAAAREQLEKKLTDGLKEEALKDIPSGYVGYSSALVSSFEEVGAGSLGTSTDVVIEGKATVRGVILDSTELSAAIARSAARTYNGEPVEVRNLGQFAFKFSSDLPELEKATSLSFRLQGTSTVEWTFDENALKKALAGQSISGYTTAFSSFPMLESIRPIISPPWIRTIPQDESRITIERVNQ